MRRLFLLACLALGSNALAWQECDSEEFFNGFGGRTCWDNNLSRVYLGSGASVVQCSGNALPIDQSQTSGSLSIDSTLPTGGYWNILFAIGFGKEVNALRLSSTPWLHLRLRWASLAGGEGFDIELDSVPPAGQQNASISFSSVATPSLSWQDVYIPLSSFSAINNLFDPTRIQLIKITGTGNYAAHSVLYIEKLRLVASPDCQYASTVKINRLGYLPGFPKLGIVSFHAGAISITPSTFQIVDAGTGSPVFSGPLTRVTPTSAPWDQSGDEVYHADFSAFDTPGSYRLKSPELGQSSDAFPLQCTSYDSVFRDASRFFYYARSGVPIIEPYAEGVTRQAYFSGETAAPYDYQAGTRDILGGLFDAGDPHKDVHAQVPTVWMMLESLKDFQAKAPPGAFNLPESDGVHSDLFPLVKWQLDWMQKLWNPDGSVQYWVNYPSGFASPLGQLSAPSSGSAAVLAALFAKAYPLFKAQPAYSAYADGLLAKAQASFAYLTGTATTNLTPAGPYGYNFDNGHDAAARALAAIELYNATGLPAYNSYFTSGFSNPLSDYYNNQCWGGVIDLIDKSLVNLGYLDYIASPQSGASSSIQTQLKAAFINQADWFLARMADSPWRMPIAASNHFFWGSSGVMCGNGYVLTKAWAWTGNAAYRAAALAPLDWIGGRNPSARTFVSGYGTLLENMDIYGYYWLDLMHGPKGYLTGNINAYSDALKDTIPDPWKRAMNLQDASTLEPGIYWNAEFAWLAGYWSTACMAPSPTPSISPSASPTTVVTLSPSSTPTPSYSFSPTPPGTFTNTPSTTLTATRTPSPTLTITASPAPTLTPQGSATPAAALAYGQVLETLPSLNPQSGPGLLISARINGKTDGFELRVFSRGFTACATARVMGIYSAGWNALAFDVPELAGGIWYYEVRALNLGKLSGLARIGKVMILR